MALEMNNGKPYKTWYYDTNIKRKLCCGVDPDLYGGGVQNGFFREAAYQFRCPTCGRESKIDKVPNGAAAYWNKSFEQIQGPDQIS